MNLSDSGAKFIAGHEGLRLNAYNDPAGHCTIGIGHLIHRGPCTPAELQQRLTEQQAYDLFRADARKFIDKVNALVKVPLTQEQFDALVSFAYNVGEGAFAGSTLLKRLNAGDYQGAAAEFGKWVRSNGKVYPGLVRRRAEEAAMFSRANVEPVAAPAPQVASRSVPVLTRGPSSKFQRAEWLHPVFRVRLEALHDAVPFTVTSGGRSTHRQAELYRAWKAYERDKSKPEANPANSPGTSWHEYDPNSDDPWTLAQAADIEPARGKTDADLHRAAKNFGLHFPIKGEPWHIQPLEAKSSKRTRGQGLGPVPTTEQPTEDEEEEMMFFAEAVKPDGSSVDGRIWMIWGWYRTHVLDPDRWSRRKQWPNIRRPEEVAKLSQETLEQYIEVPAW